MRRERHVLLRLPRGAGTDYAACFSRKYQPRDHHWAHFHNDSTHRDLARTGNHHNDSRGDDSARIYHRPSDTNYNQGSRGGHYYYARANTRGHHSNQSCARHYNECCHS